MRPIPAPQPALCSQHENMATCCHIARNKRNGPACTQGRLAGATHPGVDITLLYHKKNGPAEARPSGRGYSPRGGCPNHTPSPRQSKGTSTMDPCSRLRRRLQPLPRAQGRVRPAVPLARPTSAWSEACFGPTRSCSRSSTSPRGSVTTLTPELRQALYLEALQATAKSPADRGALPGQALWMQELRRTLDGYEEKETDVNIPSRCSTDAVRDVYDTALLVSGDSDLRPVVAAVKRLRTGKRIVAAFPPRRRSKAWRKPLTATSRISHDTGSQCPAATRDCHEGRRDAYSPGYWS